MRRFVLAGVVALSAAAAAYFLARDVAAGGQPSISSIVEGRETGTNKTVVVVIGDKLTGVKQFNLADLSGTLAGQVTLKLRTKNLVVLGLPDGLPAGKYVLRLFYGKNSTGELPFEITITNLLVGPGAVSAISLDPLLRVDLDDATTVGGRTSTDLLDAANLTGTLDAARFSAYADLVTEVRVGTAAGQLAEGDHLHDGRYLLRGGDTVSDGNFSFSASAGTAIAASANASSGSGVSGTNSAAAGVGVLGVATSGSGAATGVRGTTGAASGFGVDGYHTHASGTGTGVRGTTSSTAGAGVLGQATSTSGTAIGVDGASASNLGAGVRGTSSAPNGIGVRAEASSVTGSPIGLLASAQSADATGILIQSNGYGMSVSAGLTGLQVVSTGSGQDFAVFQTTSNKARIDGNGRGYFNGGTATSGADFAESVQTSMPRSRYEPGDVMVIDTKATRCFTVSTSPNSKLVAGVYATKPGILARPGDVANDPAWADTEVPMAIVGIVPCKVCDENGPVEAGDLLVTSSTRGHAMKAGPNPVAGTVVGKALADLEGKCGKIEVLLIGR